MSGAGAAPFLPGAAADRGRSRLRDLGRPKPEKEQEEVYQSVGWIGDNTAKI